MPNVLLGPLLLQYNFSIQLILKSDEKSLGFLSSSSTHILLHSYSKAMKYVLLDTFLLQCSFLIIFLLRTDEKCSLGPFPAPVFIFQNSNINNIIFVRNTVYNE